MGDRVTLDEVRPAALAVLEPLAAEGFPIYPGYVDAVVAPSVMCLPATPWLEQITGCQYWNRLDLLCIGWRNDPGTSLDTVQAIAAYIVEAFRRDEHPWSLVNVQAPRFVVIGGVTYLGARVGFRVPVSLSDADALALVLARLPALEGSDR
jgi:hypothetical protein